MWYNLDLKTNNFMKFKFSILWSVAGGLAILAVSMAALAWSGTLDVKSPVQVSSQAGSAILSDRGDAVTVRDNAGKILWTYKTPGKTLSRIALSEDGKYLATVGSGVRLLSVPEKKELWRWDKDGRYAVAISPDGTWIAAGGYTAKAYLFNSNSGQPVKTWDLNKKDDSPKSIAISNDGLTIAVAANLGVYLLDVESESIVWTAKPDERVQEVRLTSDGGHILGNAAHSIFYWDSANKTPIWKKKWNGSLIGAAMSVTGDKIVVSHGKGVSVFSSTGKELRVFENAFGNSDITMSANGRFFYVNSGSRRLYAFDDAYSTSNMRPFRIVRDINAGGHRNEITTNPLGSIMTYPRGNLLYVEESAPAVLAEGPSIPLIIKGQELSMGAYIINPSAKEQKITVSVALSVPASFEFWKNLAGKVSNKEPDNLKSKLMDYVLDAGRAVIYEDTFNLGQGSSKEIEFTETVPDLASSGESFSDYLAGFMSNLSPIGILNKVMDKIRGPLGKLIGKDASNLAIISAERAISTASGEIIFPVMGMGTVTIYDSTGKALDQDTFPFMYLR